MNRVTAWALDFVRAAGERPLIMRLLLRIALGKYAYREFIGLVVWLHNEGHLPGFRYNLESCVYEDVDQYAKVRDWRKVLDEIGAIVEA